MNGLEITVTDILERSRNRVEKSRHKPLYCPCCSADHDLRKKPYNIRMKPRFSTLGRYKNVFYVDNVTMKCPRCKLLLTFGVPISKEEYEEELELRQELGLGKSVRAEMEDNQTRERLVALGYLSG